MIENGNVPLDNNRAENAIHPFTVGRKNWMYCKRHENRRFAVWQSSLWHGQTESTQSSI